ncbi:MAG: cyclic pyranopterin monophosphate synthase MoaC [Planctomycetaceae bacterium]|nr:cyclic pyranopterin monophosphate synthase MoaC [Planctomycetaceae bacterium]
MSDFTHFDDDGAARMVDVGSKQATHRVAKAAGIVRMKPQTLAKITAGDVHKGNVLEVARLAGIMATKQTGNLIPLCHPLGIDSVSIDFEAIDSEAIEIEATVSVFAKTGVEMEAMTAVSVAALTIYDMCKSVDRSMMISDVRLVEKSGGKSGHFIRGE